MHLFLLINDILLCIKLSHFKLCTLDEYFILLYYAKVFDLLFCSLMELTRYIWMNNEEPQSDSINGGLCFSKD